MAKPKRPIIVRMPSVERQKKAIDEYATQIGRVSMSWNQLQETLGYLFTEILEVPSEVGFAIWHSTESDRTQRGMLEAAVKAWPRRWPNQPTSQENILALLREANSLSDHRNNAIHAPVLLHIGGGKRGSTVIGASPFPGHPRALRLLTKGDLIEEFDWVESWTDSLTGYSRQILNALVAPQNPWPDKLQRPTRVPRKSHRDRHRQSDPK